MLKALELSGFKSFADKTRLEFPPGITVVVGPNGSGKSNIVDALKWVLGEQSAKSLRGKEMADVIFKGVTGGRKPMNTAEVTVVLENDDRRLPVDAPEVHVTRRVYRSGEGEYLINRQPCRLKDIREMFRGTGVGVDAYSLIEQGKVDRMLQASSKDRRAIFEEAAGISRFKAKKVEAIRRLDRVEQNFLRLSDIVEEVENRLKTVRSQATKAKRYREHTQRLQELRTQVGMVDWKRLTEQLAEYETAAAELAMSIDELRSESELAEGTAAVIRSEVEAASTAIRRCETDFAAVREQIVAIQSNRDHQRQRLTEWEETIARQRQAMRELAKRASAFAGNITAAETETQQLEIQHAALLTEEQDCLAAQSEQQTHLTAARQHRDELRQQIIDLNQQSSAHENRIALLDGQIETAGDDLAKRTQRVAESTLQMEAVSDQLQEADENRHAAQQELNDIGGKLNAAKDALDENRKRLIQKQQAASHLQARHTGSVGRAEVLEELEQRLEGLDAGVKDILSHAESGDEQFAGVRGLVAHKLRVDVENAALIDAALGASAQHVVVEGSELTEAIAAGKYEPAGRVGIIQLDETPPPRSVEKIDLAWHPAVIGRADRLVEVDDSNRTLVHRLLAHTWLVDTLQAALELAESAGRGLRFVTQAGQVVEADGVVIVGSAEKTLGLVSRRSELRSLQAGIAEIEKELADIQTDVSELEEQVGTQDEAVAAMLASHRSAAVEVTQATSKVESLSNQLAQLEQSHESLTNDLQAVTAQKETAEADRETARQQHQAATSQLATEQAQFETAETEVASAEQQIAALNEKLTSARVAVAGNQQQLESARTHLQQLREAQQERLRAIEESQSEMGKTDARRLAAEREILSATGELAMLTLQKEEHGRESQTLVIEQQLKAEELQQLSLNQTKVDRKLRKAEEESHRIEMESERLRLERNTLAERLRDDYGIEIAEVNAEPTDEANEERESIEEEIATLRQKIGNAGAVNMDALAELDELEERYEKLSSQYNDLTDAKKSLERIISRINNDSRRLFAETLDVIRTNFQQLFRKSFGGGQADLLLEEGVDILESGIEIVCTPPGKPSFNNSLLSGGERALTAVALIMAIFQFRPSPFCVLDEVDAPFDEANIGRFVNVLTEFLGFTRFVIVTHSKKTMTSATTLYGITMQESGVSKPVSVKFEDVSEDGEVSAEAIRREDENAA